MTDHSEKNDRPLPVWGVPCSHSGRTQDRDVTAPSHDATPVTSHTQCLNRDDFPPVSKQVNRQFCGSASALSPLVSTRTQNKTRPPYVGWDSDPFLGALHRVKHIHLPNF